MPENKTGSDAAAFVAHWARVGPLLEEIGREEQRRLTESQHLQAVANVLEFAKPDPIPSDTSGLVELQNLLSKTRND